MSVNQIEIHNVMNTYKEAQQKLDDAKSKLNELIFDNGKENVLSIIFKPLFEKYSDLNIIGYLGFTPSFNDGEPCKNCSSFCVGLDYDFLEIRGNFEYDFEYDEDTETHLNSNCFNLTDTVEDIADFERLIEHLYDTNYKVVITRAENDEVKVYHDYYDAGY